MNLQEKLSNYVLGQFDAIDLPSIGETAVEEGYDSESLSILIGLTDRDDLRERKHHCESTLIEIGIELPSEMQAIETMLRLYLNIMVSQPERGFEMMMKIDNEIYKPIDWESKYTDLPSEYLGSQLGLEKLFMWYRELQDWEDGSRLFYFNELPRDEQKKKFEENLIREAVNLTRKLETEKTTHNNR